MDRRPALIARCARPADVAAALRHARDAGLPITVRAGGHGPDGFAVADGALVVDLTRLGAVEVDPARRTARVQGGATWRELDAATQAHGLAVTGARMPSVGVAGFTLGSGSGWLERRLGLAADSLRSAQVVTAGGDARHGERGRARGPVLGAARRRPELRRRRRARVRAAAGRPGDPRRADRLADRARRRGRRGLRRADGRAPPTTSAAGSRCSTRCRRRSCRRRCTASRSWPSWSCGPARPARTTRCWRRSARSRRRSTPCGPMPYAALQGLFESPERFTARVRGEGGFLTGLPPRRSPCWPTSTRASPRRSAACCCSPLGGAFARMPADATPLGRRGAPWAWQAGAAWFDPAADAAVEAWAAGFRRGARALVGRRELPELHPGPRIRPAPRGLRRRRAGRACRRSAPRWDPDGVLGAGHAIPLPRSAQLRQHVLGELLDERAWSSPGPCRTSSSKPSSTYVPIRRRPRRGRRSR